MDEGLLILRLVFGLGVASHGAQKLFGWFGGKGVEGTGAFLESLGFHPGRSYAVLNGMCEFLGGLLLALGLLVPLASALIILVMVVAIVTVHLPNGFFNERKGLELPLVYATGAALIALTGPGTLAFDAALGIYPSTEAGLFAIVLGLIGGLGALVLRQRRAPMPHPRT